MFKIWFNNSCCYHSITKNIRISYNYFKKISIFALFKNKYNMNHYETVFILNPVLSDVQIEETVKKFEDFLINNGAKMVAKENWGLKKLAYPIQNKKSGFYHLFEFTNTGEVVTPYEQEFRRDERVMRFLTVKLDKHAIAWAEKRRTRNKTAKA
jgi:small subunit ribosomal protein S6